MLATVLATIAASVSPTPQVHVDICHIDNRGNANQCTRSYPDSAEFALTATRLAVAIPPRTTVSWAGDCYIGHATVDSWRGKWNYDHTELDWPKRHVSFDGVSFANFSHTQWVNARAHC